MIETLLGVVGTQVCRYFRERTLLHDSVVRWGAYFEFNRALISPLNAGA
jgi:hypothetical protein